MLRLITLISFFLISFFSHSQEIIINGDAPDFKGKEIGVYVYDDLISNREVQKETAVVDENGRFSFSFPLSETQKIFLQIGKQRSSLFVEPGKQYKVFVPPSDSTKYVNPNVANEVGLYVLDNDSLELNNLIIAFNGKVNEFWMNNYTLFVRNLGRTKLDSFTRATIKNYSTVKNDYFKEHIEYSLWSLVYGASQGKKNPEEKYFVGKPILYHNDEYMNLFNDIFKQYIQKAAYDKNGGGLVDLIVRKAPLEKVMEALLIYNPNLKSDSLRELVLLKGLPDLYYMPEFNRESVIALLEQVVQKSKIEEDKKIASNIISSFSKLSAGKPAPNFTLVDRNGKQVSLSDFKGKYVYLDFWATWCTPCLQEMKVVPELHKAYHDKIVFVSISIDEDIEKMKKFLEKNPKYEWTFLYSGKSKLSEEYEIRTVPSYFLIGPDGNFVDSPAERPSGTIEDRFIKVTKPPVKKHKIGEKD
jgi:thiol-disulfide isomerase/thioredoxin